MGLPDSTTRFADTDVFIGSAVSTGLNESLYNVFAHQKSSISGDVDSERPAPNRLILRESTLLKMRYGSRITVF
jgi:hypothetical protein